MPRPYKGDVGAGHARPRALRNKSDGRDQSLDKKSPNFRLTPVIQS